MSSNAKVMNRKFDPLIKIHIFSNGHLFIWDCLDHSNFETSVFRGKTRVFDPLGGPTSKSHEHQVWSTRQDEQFIQKSFLHSTKRCESVVLNPLVPHEVSLSLCGIQEFVTRVYQHFLKCKNGLSMKYVSWWDKTILYSKVFHLRSFGTSFD